MRLACLLMATALGGCATGPHPGRAELERQVADTERAFARTMADRDHAAFTSAPFSWEPAEVEVLDSGTLALSSGPVHDPAGRLIGTFTSIWRLEAPGRWRIVFDKGGEVCDGEEKKK